MAPTIFSRIVAGDIPSYRIAENDDYYAFLDIQPLVRGHTLVIPKKETDYIFDLDDAALGGLMIFAKGIAHAMKKVLPCKRIGTTVIGLEVPHAHIHLIPIFRVGDMDFNKPKLSFSPIEMEATAQKIRAALDE